MRMISVCSQPTKWLVKNSEKETILLNQVTKVDQPVLQTKEEEKVVTRVAMEKPVVVARVDRPRWSRWCPSRSD